jgi:integrase
MALAQPITPTRYAVREPPIHALAPREARRPDAVVRATRTVRLIAILLCEAGLPLREAARLRVKDIDVACSQIMVRAGQGDRDRATPSRSVPVPDLAAHLEAVRRQHERDVQRGAFSMA